MKHTKKNTQHTKKRNETKTRKMTMMMKVCIFIGVVMALSSAHRTRFDSELDESWLMYKEQHNKQYEGKDEVLRRVIWESNVKYIQKHNIEYDMGKYTFSLGTNEHADMTLKEFTTKMFGYKMVNRTGGALYLPPSNVQDLPDTVDWRPKGYVTPVKNQGQCGSCWAFSATGSLEGQHFKKTGKLVSLSEQNLVDCSRAEGNQGCQGGLMDDAFNYIKKAGIDTESSYPYTGENGKCKFEAANVGATVTGFVDIKKDSEADLQNAVATVGPISVAIDANHIMFQLYRSGVYTNLFCSQTRLDHGVLAVGYGTSEEKPYWLVKNSWGESWGMKGYIMMARNHRNMCGISTSASYPTV